MLGLFSNWLARWLKVHGAGEDLSFTCTASGHEGVAASANTAASSTMTVNLMADSAIEMIGRVSNLTATVAGDVEQHSGSIQTLNNELAALPIADSAAVAAVINKLLVANQEMQGRLDQAE